MALRISPVEFPGPAGMLEGLLHHDPGQSPSWAAVVCHPHPLHGGTMHNKVVFRTTEGLWNLGMPVLRFNFRGVNLSQGQHDSGLGEMDDVRAALGLVMGRFGNVPILLAGFSFGAHMAMRVGSTHPGVAGLLAVAPPFRDRDYPEMPSCVKPKAVVQGLADSICPPEVLRREWEFWARPRRLWEVGGASHFFDRKLPELRSAVEEAGEWIRNEINTSHVGE